jgi:DNA-binding transcriptional ArsR family regulator
MRTTDLAAATGMSPAALSRHLNLLRGAGVVSRGDVDGDGRGRVYQLRPSALETLSGWLRSTSWAAELAASSDRPRTRELLSRMGGFLDAFAAGDVAFFEQHLRADALMVFPDTAGAFDKLGCLDSVSSHPPYRQHRILAEPAVRLLGASTTVITFTAEVATGADDTARRVFITAVLEEGQPWQLVHLQWTPAAANLP